ncbi:lipopolysaccharide biosynthesis protein [Sphingobacterium oryzagri]|uniref:Lipopolysaccharide biosynthesis protein n=1 Tax=Sphingobacterium oryzagri TaxID=3025669 RepID=A0ABY7WJW4_9SPHI|nr:lipopolysaccharide biosynthesis protein [Sphingobacterium sp. KACC 22765]WDF68892.1 lipopolysaccharide biosynthesis protein [Sphingobacterium sp. KACC 22765]
MSENAKQHTLKGLFWNAIDRFGNQLVTTAVGIITARILTPDDFGVLAVLIIFTTIATTFVDSGLATSLVRSPVVDDKDYSSMFVFNLLVSLTLYFLLFFAAPYIERFNGIDNLALYARVLFIQLVVHSLGIVQYVKLLKKYAFKETARINVLAVMLSGSLVIGLALFGFGVWAILLQPVSYSFFRTAMLWFWGDWRLDLTFSGNVLKKHLGFSLSFMFGSMLGKVFSQSYYAFIGKHFSLAQTGFYLQANKWGETPNMLISSIIQGTTLSTLAPIQDDYPRFLNACRKSMKSLGFVLFPVSLCAIAVAKPAFIYVLSDKWAPSILYFQLLCFAGLFISLTDLNVNFLNIKGKSNYTLWLEIIKITTAVAVLLATYRFGILYIIFGQIGIRILFFGISSVFSGKIYGYSFFRQLADLFPPFFLSAIAFAAAMAPVYFFPNLPHLAMLCIQSTIFVGIYISGNHLTGNEIWLELLQMGKNKLAKR